MRAFLCINDDDDDDDDDDDGFVTGRLQGKHSCGGGQEVVEIIFCGVYLDYG